MCRWHSGSSKDIYENTLYKLVVMIKHGIIPATFVETAWPKDLS